MVRPAVSILRQSLCLAFALAALATEARPLPNVDALSEVPAKAVAKAALDDKRVTSLHMESRLGVPSFVWVRPGSAVAGPKSAANLSPEGAARASLKGLADLYGMAAADVDAAALQSAETLAGGAHLVRLQNRLDGIEVFRESAAVILGASMEPVAIGGLFGPTRAATKLAKSATAPFTLTAAQAIAAALDDYRFDPSVLAALSRVAPAHDAAANAAAGYEHFTLPRGLLSADGARMNEPARAKRVWFRMPEGLVPAWYVELQMAETRLPGLDYYAYVVAADDGRLLFRNNQTADAAFSYRVYAESTGINLPFPGPQGRGGTPHPTGLNDGFVPTYVPANLVTLQNGPISTNDPWLASGATRTSGNNVEAWSNRYAAPDAPPLDDSTLDVDPQECNLAVAATADFRACTTSAGVFDIAYDHNAEPLANKTQSAAAVVNLFYLNNWLHDWYYDAGFKEIDGNAQASNYGRGGLGGDAIKAQAEDLSGTNNANMSTPADGGRPRMRMYTFSGRTATSVTATPGGSLVNGPATFGPQLFSVSGELILANDGAAPVTDVCTALTNNVAGKIVLIDRGVCGFVVKVAFAQAAGAIGVIMANNSGAAPPNMGGTDPTITIPTLSILQADGNALKTALLAGTVTVAMTRTKSPDPDGALDNAVVAHEWGHYISNRLIANSSGLSANQSRGLGEGWADFHSLLMMVKQGDSLDGTYAVGSYAGNGGNLVPNSAYYYGIRRYPYSRDLAKNPLTFQHIQDSAVLPASPVPRFVSTNSEVHNTGEVWANMLWSCYAALIGDSARLTFAQAQDRMKRYLVAGYKLTPANPTLLEARDALLAAMAASDSADLALCAQTFAQRGAGARAVAPDRFSSNNNGVVESFVSGGDLQVTGLALDARGADYCDADGILDNGETAYIAVTVKNVGIVTLTGATLTMSSATTGITFPDGVATLPAISPYASVTVKVRVALTGATGAGAATITASVLHPSFAVATPATASLSFAAQLDRVPASSATDDAESETSLWTATLVGVQNSLLNWVRGGDALTGHYYKAPTGNGEAVAWLTSPSLTVPGAGTVTLSIRHRHSFETSSSIYWDGGVIEVSFDNGSTWTDLQTLVPGIYGGTIDNTSGNPLGGRPGFVGASAGYPAFNTVNFPIPVAGAGTLRVRFGAGTDQNTSGPGWDVDDIGFMGISGTPFELSVAQRSQCATVSAFTGTPQVTAVNAAFGIPLTVRVMSPDGVPVAGAAVRFAAPGSGASGAFGSSGATVSAVTDASGYASASLSANATPGTYSVVATAGQRTASFTLTNAGLYSLTVLKSGIGSGSVSSNVAGIACGGDCTETYPFGAAISLQATATAGSLFSGWSGACTGTGACSVTIDGVKSVTAAFTLDPVLDADGDGIPNGVELAEGTNALVKDNDIFSAGAASARLFAMQQYRDFLNREGDAAGIAAWAGLVSAGTPRTQVIDAFLSSAEFEGLVAPVVRLYFATFLRIPDYAGVTYNAGLVRDGTVTIAQLADFFTTGPEFAALYGTLDNAQFVTLLYTNVLNRAPDSGGLAAWVNLLDTGTTRGQVLLGFSNSAEYQAAMANEVFVTMMYAGMLRRTPDQSGFNGWVGALDAATWTREQVINGFFLSSEYHGRFLP